MQKTLEQLAGTAELMGVQLSPNAAAMMVNDLSQYNPALIVDALSALRKDSKARFSIGAIIDKIESITPGGRPSPEEAWAMVPKDEKSSAVMTNEMSQALGVAQSLIDYGDMVAARMAFRESYTNIVNFNKQHSIKAEWFPSLGFEKSGRTPVLAEAVRLGRITSYHALRLVAPEEQASLFQLAGVDVLALENKTTEQDKENIQKIKLLISEGRLSAKIAEHN
jgi:hypothetical protein